MSVRPESQALSDPIDDMLNAMKAFQDAACERHYHSDEWGDDHLVDLAEAEAVLIQLRLKIAKIRKETW